MEVADKQFYKEKKVSFNLDQRIIDLIDEVADTTKTNRTAIVTAICKDGLPNYLDFLLKEWNSLLNNPKYGDKKDTIQSCIKSVKKIKEKVYWT